MSNGNPTTVNDIRRMERTLEEIGIDIDTIIIWAGDALEEMEDAREKES